MTKTLTFTPEEFVKAWQTSDNTKEVKEKLGVPLENRSVNGRAGFLRSKGVPLKKLSPMTKYDYPSLIKLAKKYLEYGRVQTVKGGKSNGNSN